MDDGMRLFSQLFTSYEQQNTFYGIENSLALSLLHRSVTLLQNRTKISSAWSKKKALHENLE
jgi:hypothetical protein